MLPVVPLRLSRVSLLRHSSRCLLLVHRRTRARLRDFLFPQSPLSLPCVARGSFTPTPNRTPSAKDDKRGFRADTGGDSRTFRADTGSDSRTFRADATEHFSEQCGNPANLPICQSAESLKPSSRLSPRRVSAFPGIFCSYEFWTCPSFCPPFSRAPDLPTRHAASFHTVVQTCITFIVTSLDPSYFSFSLSSTRPHLLSFHFCFVHLPTNLLLPSAPECLQQR